MTGVCPAGLPHSEILGSKPACGSPRLIAADRVLHRPRAPRHPPYALSSLTIINGRFAYSAFATLSDRLSKNGRADDSDPLFRTQRPEGSDRSSAWWRIPGSNRRPPGCKPGALPTELIPHEPFKDQRETSGTALSRAIRWGWWA